MKNEVCETRAQSEPRNNWEYQKQWKKISFSTESSLLAIAKADTEFFILSPFCCVGLGNQ